MNHDPSPSKVVSKIENDPKVPQKAQAKRDVVHVINHQNHNFNQF